MRKEKGRFVVINRRGLHTRPATELVKCAASFESDINLRYKGYKVNGKSLIGILMLSAGRGSKVKVEAMGRDAREAVEAILDLAKSEFNICY